MPSKEEIVQAIKALYHSNQPQSQQQANTFLIEFAATEKVWEIGLQILHEGPFQSEICYFVANLIYSKIRKQVMEMPAELQMRVSTALMQCIINARTSLNNPYDSLTIQRICLACAALSVVHPERANAFLEAAMDPAFFAQRGRIDVALDMLIALVEEIEVEYLPEEIKDPILFNLRAFGSKLIPALENILTQSSPEFIDLKPKVLACLKPWLKLEGISLSVLYSNHPNLFCVFLQCLRSSAGQLLPGSLVLMESIQTNEYPRQAERDEAISVIVQALIEAQQFYREAISNRSDDISHAITSLVASVAEAEIDWIAEGGEIQLRFVELILMLTSNSNRQIASILFDFWLELQEIPTAERHPQLREPVYIQLLNVLMAQCTFPLEGFTTWDDYHGDVDEEDFEAMRSGGQGVRDVLVSIYYLLRSQFLLQIAPLFEAEVIPWQKAEVSFFFINCITTEIRNWVAEKKAGAEISRSSLRIMFNSLLNRPNISAHPVAARSASKLLGNFACWFRDDPSCRSMLQNALNYLKFGLSHPDVQLASSISIKQFCTICKEEMIQQNLFQIVIALLEECIARGIILDARLAIVEGITRGVAEMDDHEALPLLNLMVAPTINRMQHYSCNAAEYGSQISEYVEADLMTLAFIMRFLDARRQDATATRIDVTKDLFNTVWIHVETSATAYKRDKRIMDALFQFFSWSVSTNCSAVAEKLPALANAIVLIYREGHFVSALDCAGKLVDKFGCFTSPHTVQRPELEDMLWALSHATFELFQRSNPVEETEIVQGFFDMIYHFVLFYPSPVFAERAYPTLIQLALACLSNQHRESARAVLKLMTHTVSESNYKLNKYKQQIDLSIGENLHGFLRKTIHGLAHYSPSTQFQNLGDFLYAILSVYGEQSQAAIQSVLTDILNELIPVSSVLTPEVNQGIITLFLGLANQGQKQKFRSLALDFAKVCRKEASLDMLMDYQL